jgi:hypothetical protein
VRPVIKMKKSLTMEFISYQCNHSFSSSEDESHLTSIFNTDITQKNNVKKVKLFATKAGVILGNLKVTLNTFNFF